MSPASCPTRPGSPRCCTGTARSRSGTTRPPRRTGRSGCGRRPPAASTPRTRWCSRRTSSPAARRRRGCWWCAGSWCAGRCRRRPAVAREEGGTPAIVESVRAGLAVAVKESVGADRILDLERRWRLRVFSRWAGNPHLEILGHPDAPRLPIVSVRIHRAGRVLHHEFVVALLDDLFGIQARGGCSCAGPYGHRLLCITPRRSAALRSQAARGYFGIKPGWARVTFPYFMSETVVDYVVEAVELVAGYGHRLLPDYVFDPRSGHWRHRRAPVGADPDLAELAGPAPATPRLGEDALAGQLERARAVLQSRPDELTDRPSG